MENFRSHVADEVHRVVIDDPEIQGLAERIRHTVEPEPEPQAETPIVAAYGFARLWNRWLKAQRGRIHELQLHHGLTVLRYAERLDKGTPLRGAIAWQITRYGQTVLASTLQSPYAK